MKIVAALLASSLLQLLAGCIAPVVVGGIAVPVSAISPAVETAHEVRDSSGQDSLKARAQSGDRVAQFKLGEAFCCHVGGPLDNVSVYDNNQATAWYCKSAHQGYAPAQLRLAEIYSGHPIHGFRLVQRASALLGDAKSDMSVALVWASVAAAQGDKEGAKLRDDLKAQVTPAQQAKADDLIAHWRSAPCRWSEVFTAEKAAAEAK
jgi:TPR repeat protein